MTKFITFILYWLLILPLGMIHRILGLKTLDFSWRNGANTYWEPRGDSAATERYRKQV